MTYTRVENLRRLASRVAIVLPTGSRARLNALWWAHGRYYTREITAGLIDIRTDLGKLDHEDRCEGETTALRLLNKTSLLPRPQRLN